MAEHPVHGSDSVQYLNDDEIKKFLDDLDHNNDGYIDYKKVEHKLGVAHDELVPKPGSHHVVKRDHDNHDEQVRHEFLRSMMGSDTDRIPRNEFANIVRSWKVPSLDQQKKEEDEEKHYLKGLPGWRRIRAYWTVHGPEICFLGFVVGMQLEFGIWQLVKYQTVPKYQAAFGWGVVMAKICAGALYPTFFLLILSMSRYFSTWLRRSYYVSRFMNWDLSQSFRIWISCVGILLSTLHALGHFTGSFVHGSNPDHEDAVENVLGPGTVPRPYIEYVRSLPGFTGIAALGLFYVLSLLSIPQVRRWNYEVFQLGHLLMYPMIGLLMAHGVAGLLQWPMFGYFLAFPTLLVIIERIVRVLLGFHRIPATMKVLDSDTIEISATIPSERLWKYKAGQYIFLQVPKVSFFQWHPLTVSCCRGNMMMVHIKLDGDWTEKVRQLAGELEEVQIDVGINGPFGAPAQRLYDFNQCLIIGAGIGVTPFSGILSDMQHKDNKDHGMPKSHPENLRHDSEKTVTSQRDLTTNETEEASKIDEDTGAAEGLGLDVDGQVSKNMRKVQTHTDDYRRVDFHWIVRDRNYLLWLSDLLNQVYTSQKWHHEHEANPHLEININTHVTAKHKSIVTHVYRWLLELHRTESHPASPLTGLLNPTHFGGPDFDKILDEHYEDMLKFRAGSDKAGEGSKSPRLYDSELRVGVFYCGSPLVGEILADKCRELTVRGRHDGSEIAYHFMIEVFG